MNDTITIVKHQNVGKTEDLGEVLICDVPIDIKLVFYWAATLNKSFEETCDLINNAMQTICDRFETIWQKLKQAIEAIDDICESCEVTESERVRHGSSYRENPIECKATNKISIVEKYRPP